MTAAVRLPGAAAALAPPRLAADPAGGALAAWADGSDVVVASLRGGAPAEQLRVGCLGPPLGIALAVADRAGPAVVWSGHDGIVLACVREGGSWSGPAPLSAPGAGATLVDAGAAGDRIVAVWTRAGGIVQAARHRAGEGWTRDGDIGAPGGGAITPQAAAGPGGEAIAAWVGPQSQVCWAAHPPEGPWSAGADLAPPGHGASGLRLEAGPDGDALLAWTAADAAVRLARLPLRQLAQGARVKWRTPAEPLLVSAPGDACYGPRLAAGPDGALVAWHRVDAVIQARQVDASGRMGPVEELSADGAPGLYPAPALGNGTAAVAWRGDGEVAVLALRRAEGWEEPRPVSRPGDAPEPPAVAIDARGAVTVAG